MQKVAPYKSQTDALTALDNGGRFYNLLSKADDGEITAAELRKVAGAFSSQQTMNLYLEMSLAELTNKHTVISSLSDDLRDAYHSHRPSYITSETLAQSHYQGNSLDTSTGNTAIVTGLPKQIDAKTKFTGFMYIPMTINNVTTITLIPMWEEYDVYEIQLEKSNETLLLAHPRATETLAEVNTKFGGYLKQWQTEPTADSAKKVFLEVQYYTPLKD